MAVTQQELKQHFLNLGAKGAIYLWGANCETIDETLTTRLYKTYGTSKYNKSYYSKKLKEGQGKIGADCSGSLYPLSGIDRTAAGYYNESVKKGAIKTIPKDKVCLVFKVDSGGTITHVGCYTGDGYVSEMKSSYENYERAKLAGQGWDLWCMPTWVNDYDKEQTPTNTQKASDVKMRQIKKGSTGKAVKVWQAIVGVDTDGKFGPKTYTATIKFQQKAFPNDESEWDGIVGEKTWKAGLESVK